MLKKEYTPEFKPKVSKDIFDVSQFDKMFTSEEAIHSVLPQSAQRKIIKNQDKFKGFDKWVEWGKWWNRNNLRATRTRYSH